MNHTISALIFGLIAVTLPCPELLAGASSASSVKAEPINPTPGPTESKTPIRQLRLERPLEFLPGAPKAAFTEFHLTILSAGKLYQMFILNDTDVARYFEPKSGVYTAKPLDGLPADIGLIKQFASGYGHIVFLTESNELYTWGQGSLGQLWRVPTIGADIEGRLYAPVTKLNLPIGEKIVAVYAGRAHSFFVTESRKFFAVGGRFWEYEATNSALVELKAARREDGVRIVEAGTNVTDQIVIRYEDGKVAVACDKERGEFAFAKGPPMKYLKLPSHAVDGEGKVYSLKRMDEDEKRWELSPTPEGEFAIGRGIDDASRLIDFHIRTYSVEVALFRGKDSFVIGEKHNPLHRHEKNVSESNMPHSLYSNWGSVLVHQRPDGTLMMQRYGNPAPYPIQFTEALR